MPAMRRRGFLALLLVSVACGPRPQVVAPPPSPAASPGEPLEAFLGLSSLLTGLPKEDLDPEAARALLSALPSKPLAALLEKAGYGGSTPPGTLQDLEARGLFSDPASRRFADALTTSWYSGIATTPEGPRVITFLKAVQWRAPGYASCPSVCKSVWWKAP